MLILECNKAKSNLPDFRLRNFSERINRGFLKVSANRTDLSALFDCRQTGERYSVFNYLETKNKIFYGLAQFLLRKNSLKNMRQL